MSESPSPPHPQNVAYVVLRTEIRRAFLTRRHIWIALALFYCRRLAVPRAVDPPLYFLQLSCSVCPPSTPRRSAISVQVLYSLLGAGTRAPPRTAPSHATRPLFPLLPRPLVSRWSSFPHFVGRAFFVLLDLPGSLQKVDLHRLQTGQMAGHAFFLKGSPPVILYGLRCCVVACLFAFLRPLPFPHRPVLPRPPSSGNGDSKPPTRS